MKVISEEPLLITSVSVTSNPDVFTSPSLKGTTQLSFPVTTKLREDGKKLIVEGNLVTFKIRMSSYIFFKHPIDEAAYRTLCAKADGNVPMYSASCTGRIAYLLDEPLENYEEHGREIYDQFIKPVYCVLASKLQQLIMSIGLVVTFPLAIPPMEDVKRIDTE